MYRLTLALWFAVTCSVIAAPIVPARDDEVIETLPASAIARNEDQRLRRQLARNPHDPILALQVASRHLQRARAEGDPREAGQALGALAPWRDDPAAPLPVELMRATLEQHLHDFEGAARRLERALARDATQVQGWLTLATIRRVQGDYAASDNACRRLVALPNGAVHGEACSAENAALRGAFEPALARLRALLVSTAGSPGLRAWLLTTIAQIEERAGASQAAESAYRGALAAAPDLYTALAYADFLIADRRGGEVPGLLQRWPRSDALLLRLAIVDPSGDAAGEWRARMAQANLRPGTEAQHSREQAMFALTVDRDPRRALDLARQNVRAQREPIDLLIFAQAANAAGDAAALGEARQLVTTIGLHDQRIKALL